MWVCAKGEKCECEAGRLGEEGECEGVQRGRSVSVRLGDGRLGHGGGGGV